MRNLIPDEALRVDIISNKFDGMQLVFEFVKDLREDISRLSSS